MLQNFGHKYVESLKILPLGLGRLGRIVCHLLNDLQQASYVPWLVHSVKCVNRPPWLAVFYVLHFQCD